MENSLNEVDGNVSTAYPSSIIESKSAINPQSLLWTLIAVVLFVIYSQQEDKETTLGMIQIALVLVCAIMAATKMLIGNKKLIYQPTGCIVDKQSYYFNNTLYNDILQCLKEGNIARIKALKNDSAGGLIVELLESRDKSFAAARLLKYEPHGYEAKTNWVEMN